MRPPPPVAIAAAGGVLALCWSLWLAVAHVAGTRSVLDPLEATLVDLRLILAGTAPAGESVVVVALDDAALARPDVGFPVSRTALARLVERIAEAGASALAVDILLLDEADPAADAALAAALGRIASVLAAAALFAKEPAGPRPLPRARETLWPAPAFADRAQAGLVNLSTASTGTPRHAPLLVLTARGPAGHFALQAAAAASGVTPRLAPGEVAFGERVVPLDLGLHLPLRIAGPAGTLPTIPAGDLLDGRGRERLAGRLAVLGFTATAVGDTLPTPFDPITPGVEVLAGAAAQLLGEGPPLVRTPALRRLDVAVAGALAVACTVLVALLPLAAGAMVTLLALALWTVIVCVAFMQGLWLSLALPIAAVVPPTALAALARQLHERRVARTAQAGVTELQRFHSPALTARLADPAYLAQPQTATLCILFVDLAGFTGLAERLGPERSEVLLKAFHSRVAEAVGAAGGLVLNYMGDGALAVFGAPEAAPDDADRALAAGLDLVGAGGAPDASATPPVRARAGLHRDRVMLSRLGHETHQQVSVSGDGVNLASRLLEAAKNAGADLAASRPLMKALAAPPPRPPTATTSVDVRGRRAPVDVAFFFGGPTPSGRHLPAPRPDVDAGSGAGEDALDAPAPARSVGASAEGMPDRPQRQD